MSNHKKCGSSCGGANLLNGAYLLCKSCSTTAYIGCLQNNLGIEALTTALKMDTARTSDKFTFINNTLSAMFAGDSMISFRCKQCYKDDDNLVILNENKMLKSKNQDMKKKIEQLETEISTLKTATAAASSTSTTSAPVTHDMLQTSLQQLEANIIDKINERIADAMKHNDTQQTLNDDDGGDNEQDDDASKNKKRSLLQPPKAKTKADNRSIYEIHVGNFDINITTENIQQHIMERTEILVPDMFKVEPMRSRYNKSDIATFKITTLSKQVYTQIMDTKLWEPLYTARDFEQRSVKFSKPTTNGRKYEMKKGKRYNEAHGTPRGNNGYVTKSYGRQNGIKFQNRATTINTPQRSRVHTETPRSHIHMRTPRMQQPQPYFFQQHPFMYYQIQQPPQPPPATQPLLVSTQTNPQT